MSFKNGPRDMVLEARQRACGMLDLRHEWLTHVYQVHGTAILTVSREQRGAGALTGENQIGEGDAMITAEAETPLAILIADCLPVLFAVADASVIGIAHAGWKGTLHRLSGKMVERLSRDYSIVPGDLRVWIGPGISVSGFTVGQDVWDLFKQTWERHEACFDEERHAIDLKRLNTLQLLESGVSPNCIDVSPDCAFSDKRYFSYRREGPGIGHNLAVIQK